MDWLVGCQSAPSWTGLLGASLLCHGLACWEPVLEGLRRIRARWCQLWITIAKTTIQCTGPVSTIAGVSGVWLRADELEIALSDGPLWYQQTLGFRLGVVNQDCAVMTIFCHGLACWEPVYSLMDWLVGSQSTPSWTGLLGASLLPHGLACWEPVCSLMDSLVGSQSAPSWTDLLGASLLRHGLACWEPVCSLMDWLVGSQSAPSLTGLLGASLFHHGLACWEPVCSVMDWLVGSQSTPSWSGLLGAGLLGASVLPAM